MGPLGNTTSMHLKRAVPPKSPSSAQLLLLLVQPEQRVERARAAQIERAQRLCELRCARVGRQRRRLARHGRKTAEQAELGAGLPARRSEGGMARLVQLL